MPLTNIGKRTLAGMKAKYGDAKGEEVFYAAMNARTIDATKMEKPGGAIRKRQTKEKH